MIPEYHQSIEEIISQSTPAQRILWANARLIAGENAAVRPTYIQTTAAAATELTTYSARRFWICYEIEIFTSANTTPSATGANVVVYDVNNAVTAYIGNNYPWYDTGAAANRFLRIDAKVYNILIGRVDLGNFTHVKFIGYKIAY